MSNGKNPFDALKPQLQQEIESILEDVTQFDLDQANPFSTVTPGFEPFEGTQQELIEATLLPGFAAEFPEPGIGEFLMQGFKEGLLDPLTIFGIGTDEEGLVADEFGEKAASIIGQLAGFGAALIPIGKGVGLAAKGLKATKLVQSGLGAGMSPAVREALFSGTTFAIYEAGTSEDIGQIPSHAALGFAIGAGGDVIFRKAAAAWRGSGKKIKVEEAVIMGAMLSDASDRIVAEAAKRGIKIDPRKLAIENVIEPKFFNSPEALARKLADIEGGAVPLDIVAAQYAVEFAPTGIGIIPASTETGEFIKALTKIYSGVKVHQRKVGELTELLIEAPVEFDNIVMEAVTRKVPKRRSLRSALNMIKSGTTKVLPDGTVIKEAGIPINRRFSGRELARRYRERGGTENFESLAGMATFKPIKEIFLAKGRSDVEAFSTASHELVHHVTRAAAVNKTFLQDGSETLGETFATVLRDLKILTIEEIEAITIPGKVLEGRVKILARGADTQQLTGGEVLAVRPPKADLIGKIRSEMADATYWKLRWFGMSDKAAKDEIFKHLDYFHSDIELMARMVELMWVDPRLAAEVAPFATRVMTRFIGKYSPVLDNLVGDMQVRNLGRLIAKDLEEITELVPKLRRITMKLAPEEVAIWQKTGLAPRMEVQYPAVGGLWRVVDVVGKNEGVAAILENAKTGVRARFGKSTLIPIREITRPVYPEIVRANQYNRTVLNRIVKDPTSIKMDGLGVVIRDPLTNQTNRAWIPLRDDWLRVSNYDAWREANATAITKKLELNKPVNRAYTEDNAIKDVLQDQGFAGMIANESGSIRVHLTDPITQMNASSTILEEAVGETADLTLGQLSFNLNWDNASKAVLWALNISERRIPLMQEEMKIAYRNHLLNEVVDKEVKEAVEAASAALKSMEGSAKKSAAAVNHSVETNTVGDYVTRDATTGATLASTSKETAQAFSFGTRGQAAPELLAGSPIPSDIAGVSAGGYLPDGAGKTLFSQKAWENFDEVANKFVNSLNILMSRLTGMEVFTQSAEEAFARLGLEGARPFRDIFLPTQAAATAVNKGLAVIRHAGLGNQTINEYLRATNKIARKLSRDQREMVTRYMEYLSKEEVSAPGGLLQRGMTELELESSKTLSILGVEDEMPRLIAANHIIRMLVNNKGKIRPGDVKRMIKNTETAPEETAEMFKTLRKAYKEVPDDPEKIIEFLKLDPDAETALKMIHKLAKISPDEFSLFAVSRHMSARPLDPKFKTGRAQFAAENALNEQQLKIANQLDKYFGTIFEQSGIDQKRFLGGYWPHMRVLGRRGLRPEHFRDLPDSFKWTAQKFRTGELDLYELDPIVGALKYGRMMLMKQHFDPIMKGVKKAVTAVKQADQRVGNVLDQYVDEVIGRPHTSFQKLQDALEFATRAASGKDLPKDFARRYINIMTSLAYGATIPFRAALIARNYFQMVQMIPPRVGWSYYIKGLQRAMSKEGYAAAVEAGAVPPNVLPVFASTEIFEQGVMLNIARTRLGETYRTAFERGFQWYKSADDFSRAVAFHAQKARLNDAVSAYRKGQINFDKMLERGKVKTYKQIDQDIFIEKFHATGTPEVGVEAATNYLSLQLEKQTIFRYGQANHPAGWGGVWGRLFGQFGTWPVQYKDFLVQGVTRGTVKDKAEFLMTHAATNVGVVAAGDAMGLDLWSWVSFPSLQYTGGPFMDIAVNGMQIIGGSEQERALALKSMSYQFPTLSDPSSILLPGSYALGDAWEGFTEGDTFVEGLVRGVGFRLSNPRRESGLERVSFGLLPDIR